MSTVPLSPLTGPLDTRSLPNEIAQGGVRWRQNLRTTEEGKLCRGDGWTKFQSSGIYNNADLHDQLLTFKNGTARQPITFLREFESSRRVHRLFAASQSTVYRYNAFTQNYAVLGTGYGVTGTGANTYRWQASLLGDYIIWTNNFNKVMAHAMEEATDGGPSLKAIDDLDTIGLSRAAVTWSWRNVVFLADVVMDGDRYAYRLVWSDYDGPTSFDPAKVESIAGMKDLFFNERIMAGAPAGNSFLIYTTHGIWEMTAVGGAQSFAFRRIYNGGEGKQKCLFYANTLLNIGDVHLFMGEDRIYQFSQYLQVPAPPEWLDRASGALYKDIDASACNAQVGFYEGNEVYFSVAKTGDLNQCPSQTLRANVKFKCADYIDHGFTAFAQCRPDAFQNIRDFFIDNKICTPSSLASQGYGFINEGLPAPVPAPTAAFAPQSIYTQTPLTVGDVTTEDYTQLAADADSLCALLAGKRFDELCLFCDGKPVFVAASSQDWCLKEMNGVYYRERCANPTAVGSTGTIGYTSSAGSYLLDGYTSLTRWPGANGPELLKALAFHVEYLAEYQASPSLLSLRVGLSGQMADPNTDDCRLVWRTLSAKPLKCLSQSTAAQHRANNTSPNLNTHWNFEYTAKYIYFELGHAGTGGAACFSGVSAELSPVSSRNYG